ncbi:VanZ family protein [Algoriphagus kandeliae]|uniref:VanZ family protein n=1 Tax=Algoriphagus kandeliae TaxID=2562278 RepID=A0A4Y9QQB2_9BACT|nr:VanZ family protein [Algoriphagus kandeliae]
MLTPGDRLPEINAFDFQDKVIHTICFLVLSFIWAGVSSNHLKKGKKSINWLIFIPLAIIPSVAFEIGQLWIPNRSFDWWDLVFNQLGIWLGLFGYFKI